jgi:hypothetical protein
MGLPSLGKPIDLELAFCLTLIALCFEIAFSLLKMEPSRASLP